MTAWFSPTALYLPARPFAPASSPVPPTDTTCMTPPWPTKAPSPRSSPPGPAAAHHCQRVSHGVGGELDLPGSGSKPPGCGRVPVFEHCVRYISRSSGIGTSLSSCLAHISPPPLHSKSHTPNLNRTAMTGDESPPHFATTSAVSFAVCRPVVETGWGMWSRSLLVGVGIIIRTRTDPFNNSRPRTRAPTLRMSRLPPQTKRPSSSRRA